MITWILSSSHGIQYSITLKEIALFNKKHQQLRNRFIQSWAHRHLSEPIIQVLLANNRSITRPDKSSSAEKVLRRLLSRSRGISVPLEHSRVSRGLPLSQPLESLICYRNAVVVGRRSSDYVYPTWHVTNLWEDLIWVRTDIMQHPSIRPIFRI